MDRHWWGWRGGEAPAAGSAGTRRLDRALRRLEALAASSAPGMQSPEDDGERTPPVACALSPPALLDTIAEAELRLGTALPADYVRFLLRHDGARLSLVGHAAGDEAGGAELLGAAALVRQAEELEFDYRAGCIPEVVVFATVGAAGDRLAFATSRTNPLGGCAVLDARRGCHPEHWWVIARDFTSWLVELLRPGRAAASLGRDWSEEMQLPLPFDEIPDLDPVEL